MSYPLSIFDYQPRTRIVFGNGTLARLGELAREIGAESVLLVTDPGIVEAGHAQRALASLKEAQLGVTVYDSVNENPTTEDVDACLAETRSNTIDVIVGLGGGSSIDTARGCNFLYTNGGQIKEYWGVGKATHPMLPMIAVPTTAGTGSECQSFALIADPETHQKMACGDPRAAACIAILDPELTVSQPSRVSACSGIDAMAHAVETAVTTKRTPISRLHSSEAFRLVVHGLPRVMTHPDDLEARGKVLLGAAYAGLAIENSMLGAAHALANPLTAHHGIIHGHAVGLMLPWVVRHNAQDPDAARIYAELAVRAELVEGTSGVGQACCALARYVDSTMDTVGLPRKLSSLGITFNDIDRLADEASKQWTGNFNPRPMGTDEYASVYARALSEY